MEPNEQIKISELPSQLPNLTDFIAKANDDGLATKTTIEEIVKLIEQNTGSLAPSFVVSIPEGQSLGKYKNGDIVPEFATVQEQLKDIGQLAIPQTFTEPTATITSIPNSANSLELGTSLSVELQGVFIQNDAGNATGTIYLKDGLELATNTDIIKLTLSGFDYRASISYEAGTGFKTDALGNVYPNTIQAGTVESGIITFKGYEAIFFDSVSFKPTNSTEVRVLDKRLTNSGNTFLLNTGTTETIFCLWLPDSKTLVSVIDLDALNAEITSAYIIEPLVVNDANNTPVSGNLYTMTQGVPYDVNHRHQITIS